MLKEHVKKWIHQATEKPEQALTNIFNLYKEDNDELLILFNSKLNKESEYLAELLMLSIISANSIVESHIKQVFEFYC